MDLATVKEVAQLGGLAVVSLGILYVFLFYLKDHTKELKEGRNERMASYQWFQKYVSENNHDQTDRFKEHTKALVDVTVQSTQAMNSVAKNIEANTEVTKKTFEILDTHSKLLEKLANEVRFKMK